MAAIIRAKNSISTRGLRIAAVIGQTLIHLLPAQAGMAAALSPAFSNETEEVARAHLCYNTSLIMRPESPRFTCAALS
jgi:hypothetical protein